MAGINKTEELLQKLLKILENDKYVRTIEGLAVEAGINKSTIYNHFPIPKEGDEVTDHKFHGITAIKAAIDRNNTLLFKELYKDCYNSDNATLKVIAMKLAANDKDFERMTSQVNKNENKTEHSGEIKITIIPSQGDE